MELGIDYLKKEEFGVVEDVAQVDIYLAELETVEAAIACDNAVLELQGMLTLSGNLADIKVAVEAYGIDDAMSALLAGQLDVAAPSFAAKEQEATVSELVVSIEGLGEKISAAVKKVLNFIMELLSKFIKTQAMLEINLKNKIKDAKAIKDAIWKNADGEVKQPKLDVAAFGTKVTASIKVIESVIADISADKWDGNSDEAKAFADTASMEATKAELMEETTIAYKDVDVAKAIASAETALGVLGGMAKSNKTITKALKSYKKTSAPKDAGDDYVPASKAAGNLAKLVGMYNTAASKYMKSCIAMLSNIKTDKQSTPAKKEGE